MADRECVNNGWYVCKCNECYKILGITEVCDEDGTITWCLECGKKKSPAIINDWNYGKGWDKINTCDIK